MSKTEYFAATPHGRIHCMEQGDGPPLLLLHSNGCSLHEFDAVLPLLARHYRCIAWDLPGHGDSDGRTGHLSITDYADCTLALMDSLQIPRAHVCGVSVGGFIAIALGHAAPARILSATIAEAALRTADEWAAQWPRIEAMFAIAQQTHDEVASRMRQLTPQLLARWNIDRAKAGGWRMVDVMWAIREYDAMAGLRNLKMPAAVLLGERGPVVAGRSRYEQALPAAPIRVLADAGHFPMLDTPEAFAQAVHEGIVQVTAA